MIITKPMMKALRLVAEEGFNGAVKVGGATSSKPQKQVQRATANSLEDRGLVRVVFRPTRMLVITGDGMKVYEATRDMQEKKR